MGILNRTPDSFYDGGVHWDEQAARQRVRRLVDAGADIVDLGAESTRPTAAAVSATEQIARLGDLVSYTAGLGVVTSVDTTSPEVARWALERGARVVNSVSLAPAAELGELVAAHGARLVLTHCRGTMSTMRGFSDYSDHAYDDIVTEVGDEWRQAAERAMAAGLGPRDVVFDPGLGFTKNARQSLELCARLGEFRRLDHPILVGTSRKSYIAHTVAAQLQMPAPPPDERLGGSIAAVLGCVALGADIVRVHDVTATRQALAYAAALNAVGLGVEPAVEARQSSHAGRGGAGA